MKRFSFLLLLSLLAISALPGCKSKKLKSSGSGNASADYGDCPGVGEQLSLDCLALWPRLESVGYYTTIGKDEVVKAAPGHAFVVVQFLLEAPEPVDDAEPSAAQQQVAAFKVELVDGTDRTWSRSPEGERAYRLLRQGGVPEGVEEGADFRVARVFELEASATETGLFLIVEGKGCDATPRFCLGRRRLALESDE